ncbi:class I tRNA ligase family protein, partial [Patescibacteria group bacterium]|nr:class I tRNA ligase family protein [Patescibacteria group bacterium]
AKERLSVIDGEYEILKEMKGKDLLGLEYELIYDFIKPDKKAHFVVLGEFVSMEDGTGIVHIAPVFGAEDMKVGKENNLPVILTVDEEGKFKEEIKPWAGTFVKNADKEIVKNLQERNLLFKSETITHTYPFCWRCDSPLLYYPLDTWYIAVEKIKDQLIKNNKKINWVPEHIKEGRFGKWLEGVRDWAFTRNRFWGAPVPIWKCDKCGNFKAIGSFNEIKQSFNGINKIFLIRHAEAENNVSEILSSWPEKAEYHLTEKGKEQAKKMAEFLKKENIDLIFSSPVTRTKETAEIIAKKLDIKVIFDERLREMDYGDLEGKAYRDFERQYPRESRIEKTEHGIETGNQIKERLENFLEEINKKYSNKNIIIISHGDPIQIFYGITQNLSLINSFKGWYPKKGSVKIIYSKPIDLHRPYIDEIVLDCEKCGDKMKRVEEVFDCWFESGAMPYAQYHYPFENKKFVEDTFPADFIAEGLDQTRGWFYTLHILSTALFNNQAFKNVVVNGLILDSQGRKLSKKLRNYIEPEEIVDKFGADALRFYLLSSTAIGEDYLFSDKGVQESMRKVVTSFYNSLNFLKTYSGLGKIEKPKEINNILDRWILIKLQKIINDVTGNMDKYDLTRASRVFIDFFDDLTNWYIRRSRPRFQHPESEKDYENAVNVLHYVLIETSKLLAPFSPFVSEAVYQELKGEPADAEALAGKKESVHLEEYPEVKKISKEEEKILENMEDARKIVSIALEERSKHGVKVRQVLDGFATTYSISDDFIQIVQDEINVKKIKIGQKENKLDLEITEELKNEGIARELVRNIQDLRKKAGLKPQDKIGLIIETNKDGEEIIKKFDSEIKKLTNTTEIKFSENSGEEIKVEDLIFKIEIKK